LETVSVHRATATQTVQRRVTAALRAGAIAIILNEVALWSAELIHLQSAHGGLLKLPVELAGVPTPHSGALNIAFVDISISCPNAFHISNSCPNPRPAFPATFCKPMKLRRFLRRCLGTGH
jgi:prepilin-type processing-associated H-X9-DG protein